ncbi:filamentous hemagglutinin N-terminal domain-containing protein [Hyella patelloides]|uniref:two-partner secretion domain-containing protein n=1 Tax=Hyella patelloides TaxID=1982969 RepID=UPI001FE63511|nr:filamentous hemagglutinin N-terminal domain-containing protein [Hyella patelloides]
MKIISTTATVAQVTVDDTTSTTVTPTDTGVQIDNGDSAEGNLFHSFEQFSIPTGSEAFFNNAENIVNIFSRVTGGNISNIDGLIRANGTANLFLINPAGIVLGEGARLQLGGSFYGSTADSIVFGNGEFSATDLDNPPLITINAPIGLGFRDNPGEITVRGDGLGARSNNDLIDTENALRVNSSSTLGLVGGNLNLEGATLKTDGGRIELGSVAGNGQVSLTPREQGFGLEYESVENWGDVQLSESATVDASGLVSGDIRVEGNSITLTEGSQIEASTLSNLPSLETPGMIEINATDTINIDGENSQGFSSGAFSQVNPEAEGDARGVTITTGNLNLTNGAVVDASTEGRGNAGSVEITASDTVTIDGADSQGFPSGAFSRVNSEAEGDAGGVTITTGNLNLTNGAVVDASTEGRGNAGSVEITASDTVTIDGADSQGFPSGVGSIEDETALGDAGGITITTGNLTLTNGGIVDASAFGRGNAGLLTVRANSVSLDNNATIDASTSSGIGGSINLQIAEDLTLSNNSLIAVGAFDEANGGNLDINARFIIAFLGNGANNDIIAGADQGQVGNINITAQGLFGIQQRPPNPATNDIDASSDFGLDGTIAIETADNSPLREIAELSSNVFSTEIIAASNICSVSEMDKVSNFIVKGKGGVMPEPTEALYGDALIIDEELATSNFSQTDNHVESSSESPLDNDSTDNSNFNAHDIRADVQPVAYKDNGEPVYLARGLIKQEDGTVILTALPTASAQSRTLENPYDCSQ